MEKVRANTNLETERREMEEKIRKILEIMKKERNKGEERKRGW